MAQASVLPEGELKKENKMAYNYDVADFLDKYGFGDGDSWDQLEWATEVREEFVSFLNDQFSARGLSFRAQPNDMIFSGHNQCRVYLYDEQNRGYAPYERYENTEPIRSLIEEARKKFNK